MYRASNLHVCETLPLHSSLVKAKFHYAIQVAVLVADLVSDLTFDKFARVCDQLATFLGRKQVADRFELSRQARFELIRETAT